MLFFNEYNQPIVLGDLKDPIPTTHFWALDLEELDFTLAPLKMLEEITCPSITLDIEQCSFNVPANWNILVCDPETSELDVVDIGTVAGRGFHAITDGPDASRIEPSLIRAVDYSPERIHVTISLNKNQMLCHPISDRKWVCIAPADSYNKYIKNRLLGDLAS